MFVEYSGEYVPRKYWPRCVYKYGDIIEINTWTFGPEYGVFSTDNTDGEYDGAIQFAKMLTL
jgi:hypothetical protein